MYVKKLELENVGIFQSLTVDLAPAPAVPSNVTIIIGNNGAGKTTILKSLATSLSWLVARLRTDRANGSSISEDVIRNDAVSAAIRISVDERSDHFGWTLSKVRSGRKSEHASHLDDTTRFADKYKQALSGDVSTGLPLIAFYPVERSVLEIPLRIKEKHTFSQLDGYDNSLNQGVDFRRFFEWFREREDWENEVEISTAAETLAKDDPEKFKNLADFIENGKQRIDDLKEFDSKSLRTVLQQASRALQLIRTLQEGGHDPQLGAVRRAIGEFMPGFRNLKVRRKPRLHMSVDKQEERLNILQLSQGEKSLMALVGDIARRLAMMNPGLDNPLNGNGVVLIDEVDLHLHPRWARGIVDQLRTTFPNCQFVLTTHSPLVISDCKDVLVYALDNGALTQIPSQYGQDVNTVLLDVMYTHIRNPEVDKRLNDLLDFIQDGKLSEAKHLRDELKQELPSNNLELIKAGLLLRKKEQQRAKD